MSKKEKSEPEVEVMNATPIVRTPAGLRNKLYDLWDDYEFGRIQASRVLTFVRLAGEINKTTCPRIAPDLHRPPIAERPVDAVCPGARSRV
jgi:hypothetical protein